MFLYIQKASYADGCAEKYSLLIFDEKESRILLEERAENIIYPASLTKIMTAFLAFEALEDNKIKSDQKIYISEYAEEISAYNKVNSLHLKAGDVVSVEEAIEGMIVKSFNEMSVALAELIAGDEWNFARMMNKKAEELGMKNSHFLNSSGIHEAGQYSTAYDLARLFLAIEKKFPQYRHYFLLKEFVYNRVKYKTHNHFLLDYKGANGFKTGFTNAAGFNLMASAKKNGQQIDSVLVGCESRQKRDEFSKALFDRVFSTSHNHEKEITIQLK